MLQKMLNFIVLMWYALIPIGNVPLYSDPSTFRPALPGRKVIHTQPNVMGPSLLDPNQMTMESHIKQVSGRRHVS